MSICPPQKTQCGVYWEASSSSYYFSHGCCITEPPATPSTSYGYIIMCNQNNGAGKYGWTLKVDLETLELVSATQSQAVGGALRVRSQYIMASSSGSYIYTSNTVDGIDSSVNDIQIVSKLNSSDLSLVNQIKYQNTVSGTGYNNSSAQGGCLATDPYGAECVYTMFGQLTVVSYTPPDTYVLAPGYGNLLKYTKDLEWDENHFRWALADTYFSNMYIDPITKDIYLGSGSVVSSKLSGAITKVTQGTDSSGASQWTELTMVNQIYYNNDNGANNMIDAAVINIIPDSSSASFLWATGQMRIRPESEGDYHAGVLMKIRKTYGASSHCTFEAIYQITHDDFYEFLLGGISESAGYLYVTRRVIKHNLLGSDQWLYPHKAITLCIKKTALANPASINSCIEWVRGLDGGFTEMKNNNDLMGGIYADFVVGTGWTTVTGSAPGYWSCLLTKTHCNINSSQEGCTEAPLDDYYYDYNGTFRDEAMSVSSLHIQDISSSATNAAALLVNLGSRVPTLVSASDNPSTASVGAYLSWGGATLSVMSQATFTLDSTTLTSFMQPETQISIYSNHSLDAWDVKSPSGFSYVECIQYDPPSGTAYDSYIQSNDYSLSYTYFQSSIDYRFSSPSTYAGIWNDSTARIDSITAHSVVSKPVNPTRPAWLRTAIRSSSGTYNYPDWTLTGTSSASYFYSSDEWTENPFTTQKWTWADVESLVGVFENLTQKVSSQTATIRGFYSYALIHFRPFRILTFNPVGGVSIGGSPAIRFATYRGFLPEITAQSEVNDPINLEVDRINSSNITQPLTTNTVNTILVRELLSQIDSIVESSGKLEVTRQLINSINNAVLTPNDINFQVERLLLSDVRNTTITQESALIISREIQGILSSNIQTNEVLLKVFRELSSQINVSVETISDLIFYVTRELTATIVNQTTTNDVLLKNLVQLLFDVTTRTLSNDVLLEVSREITSNVNNFISTDNLTLLVNRLLQSLNFANITITSQLEMEIAFPIKRELIALINSNTLTMSTTYFTVARQLINLISAVTLTEESDLKVAEIIEFLVNVRSYSSALHGFMAVDRNLQSTINIDTNAVDVLLAYARRFYATITNRSTTDESFITIIRQISTLIHQAVYGGNAGLKLNDIIYFYPTMNNTTTTSSPEWLYGVLLAASISGVVLPETTALSVARELQTGISANTDTEEILIAIARILNVDIINTVDIRRIRMILTVLGLILNPSITSDTTQRSVESVINRQVN